MGRSCCVPGCKSNYSNASRKSIFKFPKEKTLREKWIRSIHRDDFEVNDKTVVCIDHFEDKFVVREDVFPVLNGEPIRIPRKYPKLTNDAYPTIFPNQPSYLTVRLSKGRKDPAERVQQILQRDEENFNEWCEQDTITNFDTFISKIRDRQVHPFTTIVKEDYVIFIKIDDNGYRDVPSVSMCFKVSSDLDVSVFYKNLCLPVEKFGWILECNGNKIYKCDRWSKLENLVSCLANYNDETVSLSERVTSLINVTKEGLLLDADMNVERAGKIKFALEQLELAFACQIKYSADLLIWAASLSYSHPGAYQSLRRTNMMTLPHHVYLRQFLSKIGPNSSGVGPLQKSFLREKSKLLNDEEKVVTILLDEIYVNSKLTYKAGKIIGMAENGSGGDSATTIQAFMFSSLHSDIKDIIGLFPVRSMNAKTLLSLTIDVLTFMDELQFDVVCLISDNHSMNRKMFELLGGGTLKPCIANPANPSKSLFLLFDSVHLLKCVRNNWLNQPSQTFVIPNTDQTIPKIESMLHSTANQATFQYTDVEAKLSDIRDLFHSEKNMILKLAPNLSRKALYPTAIERQNVALAMSIFDTKNIVALDMLKKEGVAISDGTVQFLKLVSKWWTICNVQHPMKGKYTKNDDANPINGPGDCKLVFLETLKTYLDIWHSSTSHTNCKLSNETFVAFTHTLTAVIQLCKHVFSKYKWSYILTAKLQTDSLEGRFGAYRRLSGCTYNVSVEQVLESERRLKVLSLLKLQSAKLGEFTLKDLTVTFSQGKVVENLDKFQSALDEIPLVSIPLETKKIIVCIASYTSMKVLVKLRKTCAQCKLVLQSEDDLIIDCDREKLLSYFSELNRGGLKCPSSFLICLCCDVYRLVQILISSRFEPEFLKLDNQRDAVITLGIQFIESNISNINDECSCGVPLIKVVKKCVKVFANIFVNNYSKVLHDRNVSRELSKKLENQTQKRKPTEELGVKVHKRKELKLTSK